MKRLSQFFDELKRRNVFRAGVAYVVLAWLVVQAADILLDTFAAPEWVMRTLVVALSLGFPATLVLAWIYEITTTGVKRTEDVAPEESITDRTGRKLDFVIIGFLAVAVAVFAIDRFVWEQFDDGTAADPDVLSVAVLPFNLESDQVAPFFGQLSNDLAQLLRRSGQLRLASSDAVEALPTLSNLVDHAAQLGVRYLVSGVIRFSGDDMRLFVSLFDSNTGDDIWSSEFEDAHLQQATNAVAREILLQIDAKPLSLPSITTNPRAYELYLSARQHLAADNLSEEVEHLYREAIGLDARFPRALAGMCSFLVDRYQYLKLSSDFEEAERLCHRAWTIDPQSTEVQLALGHLYRASGQTEKARESYAAALAINPNGLDTQIAYATTYIDEQPDLAEIQLKRIIQQHPGSPSAYLRLQYFYYNHGRYEEAVEPARWAVRLHPGNERAESSLAGILMYAGKFSEAKSLLMAMLESDSIKTGSIENNLATLFFYEGDYAEAVRLFSKAVDREPEDSLLYRNLGDAIV